MVRHLLPHNEIKMQSDGLKVNTEEAFILALVLLAQIR